MNKENAKKKNKPGTWYSGVHHLLSILWVKRLKFPRLPLIYFNPKWRVKVESDKMMSYVQEKKCFEDETVALVSCEISEKMIRTISFLNAKNSVMGSGKKKKNISIPRMKVTPLVNSYWTSRFLRDCN